jgi:phage/conjugal plasmid C-4 type zinc finger TraR family protein
VDEADRTQAISEVYEDAALRSHRAAVPRPDVAPGRKCADCGRRIPYMRLRANPGAIRCIKCQSIFETGGTT